MSNRLADITPVTTRDGDSLAVSIDFASLRAAKRELVEELRAQREQGQPVQPEELLQRWPTDPHTDADVASLLFEDYCKRKETGEEASIVDYEQRFPEHQDSLAVLVRQHAVWRSLNGTHGSSTTSLALPSIGDELFGFRLCQELGRGAFARVFLAEQNYLAGRPVVLKVSAADGDEPQTLAQLQHTHIVPIYSVHEDSHAGLRAVCMPYFGGASLSAVLKAVFADADVPMHGEQLVRALSIVQSPWSIASHKDHEKRVASPPPSERGTLRLLERSSYVQSVVWIAARLAEALEHAHQRGILHRDIKPSNVLLSADGEPMLLDFNLAQRLTEQSEAHATLGGTVAYMAPEHLLAIARREPELARQVGWPADIYSLGMVLYEMLTGRSPFDQSVSYHVLPSLIESMATERQRAVPTLLLAGRGPRVRGRLDAPWSLESIIRKCLAPDQTQRYQQADHLAEDLRRFLDDRPLKYAPELSKGERVRKWLRRHPRITSSSTVAAAAAIVLLAVAASLVGVSSSLASARESLEITHAQEEKRAYTAGTERALCLVNTTSAMRDHLSEGIGVCEQTLAIYGILEHADWQTHPSWQRLPEQDRERLCEDTRELLMMLAWARVRTAEDSEASLREALALLDRAERIEGLQPSPALWLDRAEYLSKLGDASGARVAQKMAEQTPPNSARDHYLLATTLARSRHYTEAINELNAALRINDRYYWSWFQRGVCEMELGRLNAAAGDFGACIGLWPEFTWGHFNRGYVFYRTGLRAEAIEDYTTALRCDPTMTVAVFNRGLAYKELERFDAALADFERAAELGRDDALLHAERGLALEKLGRTKEADAAFAAAWGQFRSLTHDAQQTLRLTYGFAVAERLPEQAREAFSKVAKDKTATGRTLAQAFYGQAMLASVERPHEAIHFFSKALDADVDLIEARRFRSILWARVGDFEAAGKDINWCLEREPKAGGTLYAAACVTALAAKRIAEPAKHRLIASAVELLQQAFAQGYGKDKAASDADLATLHGRDEFKRLMHLESQTPARQPR
jgi:serine/threonine protein kinase/tetratricopeptide (TPR) repeat protein